MSAIFHGRAADPAPLATAPFRFGLGRRGHPSSCEVALQPLECACPGVLRGAGLVLGPLVAVEPVACASVADDLVLGGDAIELGTQALDVFHRDRPVEVAEE